MSISLDFGSIIPLTAGIVALFVGLLTIYEKLIKPRLISTKLRHAISLINDWFDLIDCNLEKGIDFSVLDNKEKKVIAYINANLKNYKILINNRKRRLWLKELGMKKSLRNSAELFSQCSRMTAEGDNLLLFYTSILGNFYSFHSLYKSNDPSQCNFANIEMPIKFLNFIVKSH